MTRVNVGINPAELCDQHLLAEYRELPRCWYVPRGYIPQSFTLGTGHMNWCAQYQGSLRLRQCYIIDELTYRGYNLNYKHPLIDGGFWSTLDDMQGREWLQYRLRKMLPLKARWTKRSQPCWYEL